jgi:hypothetical protein
MNGVSMVRLVLGVIGALLVIGGAYLAFVGSDINGYWFIVVEMIIGGMVLVLAAVLEITRYRAEGADHTRAEPGPGGGEPAQPEARFRPTDEVFVDPTTHLRMRVFADQRTGERRYVAES